MVLCVCVQKNRQHKRQEVVTKIPEKLLEIMKKDGVVAIATLGKNGPHMVNTWNSYIRISADERLFIPAGYMHKTEANIVHNRDVLITLGSSKVKGLHGAGAGFFDQGKGAPTGQYIFQKLALRAPSYFNHVLF